MPDTKQLDGWANRTEPVQGYTYVNSAVLKKRHESIEFLRELMLNNVKDSWLDVDNTQLVVVSSGQARQVLFPIVQVVLSPAAPKCKLVVIPLLEKWVVVVKSPVPLQGKFGMWLSLCAGDSLILELPKVFSEEVYPYDIEDNNQQFCVTFPHKINVGYMLMQLFTMKGAWDDPTKLV